MVRRRGEYRIVEVQETGENGYISGSWDTHEAAEQALQDKNLRENYPECRFFVEWLDLSDPDDPDDYDRDNSEDVEDFND